MPDNRIVFRSIREASAATGIPLELFQLASANSEAPRGISGFHESGRVYWSTPEQGDNTLEKWFISRKEQFESIPVNEDKNFWDTRKSRAAALLDELELEEKYNRVVNKQAIHDYNETLSAALVSLFNAKLRQELPARLNLPPEKIIEIDKVLTELFAVIQKGRIAEWKQ